MLRMAERELVAALEEAMVTAEQMAEATYWCHVEIPGCRITLPVTPVIGHGIDIEHDRESEIGHGFAIEFSEHLMVTRDDGEVLDTDPEDLNYDWAEAMETLLGLILRETHQACRDAVAEQIEVTA